MLNYLLVKKKMGNTDSAHARLNEVTDISPFYKLLNLNFLAREKSYYF